MTLIYECKGRRKINLDYMSDRVGSLNSREYRLCPESVSPGCVDCPYCPKEAFLPPKFSECVGDYPPNEDDYSCVFTRRTYEV